MNSKDVKTIAKIALKNKHNSLGKRLSKFISSEAEIGAVGSLNKLRREFSSVAREYSQAINSFVQHFRDHPYEKGQDRALDEIVEDIEEIIEGIGEDSELRKIQNRI